MFQAYRVLIANQFEAALCTFNYCLKHCPDDSWNAPVANSPFCQVAFHTLFFTDYYLGKDEESFKRQEFHQANKELFADYEQMQDREPTSLYERIQIDGYLKHCREKASAAFSNESEATLSAPCGFARRSFSRAELHVYNMRHIHHHAAQMSLRLRLSHAVDVPWIGSGWREV